MAESSRGDSAAAVGGRWTARLAASVAAASALLAGPAVAQDGTLELSTITVDGGASLPVGPDVGLLAANTTTGTKTDTPIELIPQSVSVVTEDALEQRRPQTLEEAIGYMPGVVPSPWGADNRFEQFLIRGFDVGTYGIFRDGLAQKVIGFSGFKIEPYSLQRIEVLRGPNAVLYGESDPGGIVNAVTKRPSFEPLREGFVSYGPFDSWQGGFDLGGAVGQSETLAYRLTGLYRDGETSLDGSYDDRQLIAPALTWQPDTGTSLTVLGNWQKDKTSPSIYLPVAGEDYPEELGDLPGWMWDTVPQGYNHYKADIASAGYLFSHDLAPDLTLRQNLRYSQQDTDYRQFYFNGMATDDSMSFVNFTVDETAELFAVDNQLEYRFGLGGTENILLLGFDYNRAKADSDYGYDGSYLISVTDPSFDIDLGDAPTYYDGIQIIEQFGLYAQDQMQIADRLHLSFGLRQAWVDNSFDDHLADVTTDPFYVDQSSAQDYDKLVGNIGLVYEFANGIAPYASYSTGFVTNLGSTFDGSLYEPTEAEQYEIGARYQPAGIDALFSAALFDITKTNVLTTDPDNAGFWVQTGEVRHRGLELEGNVNLTDGLSAVAAYTYIDAEITSSNDGDEGNVPSLVPEHEASLWANYAVMGGRFEGVSFGGGVRYVGESYGDTTNTRETPGRTLFDAALRYGRGRLEGALNVTNLFDKDYYSICYAGGGCTKGDPREVQATLTVRF